MTRRRITRRGRRNFTLDELLRERGEIRGANERTASNPEEVGVSDIDGLTHKDIHEACIIRDAEVERRIAGACDMSGRLGWHVPYITYSIAV